MYMTPLCRLWQLQTPSLLAVSLVMVVICATQPLTGQTPPIDPVADLQRTLRENTLPPRQRQQELMERIEALRTLSDLRQALVLTGWQDQDLDVDRAEIDRRCRQKVARRLEESIRARLGQGVKDRLAMALLLVELGRTCCEMVEATGLANAVTPDLVSLTKDDSAEVRAAAASALGRINTDADTVAPVLARLLAGMNTHDRRAAAQALAEHARAIADLAQRMRHGSNPEARRGLLASLGCAVAPVAGQVLGDTDLEVRRAAAATITLAAGALGEIVSEPQLPDGGQTNANHRALETMIGALAHQVPALIHSLADADLQVRAEARKSLESLASARQTLIKGPGGIAPPAADVLLDKAGANLAALAERLADKDARTRRSVADILATLGPAAAAAVPELVHAVTDIDPFVRWAAARALGHLGPAAGSAPVSALASRLDDTDPDVRHAAALALSAYGLAAGPAVPALAAVLRDPDVELRLAALRALKQVGPEARAALRSLRSAQRDPDPRVRDLASQVLSKLDVPSE
jgi:HEAT repeat protein